MGKHAIPLKWYFKPEIKSTRNFDDLSVFCLLSPSQLGVTLAQHVPKNVYGKGIRQQKKGYKIQVIVLVMDL